MRIHSYCRLPLRARKIRKILRGYNIMKKSGGIKFYRDLVSTFVVMKFQILEDSFSQRFFGAASPFAEISVRQFLLTRLINIKFHDSICMWYASGKPIRYPLPMHWQRLLEESGVRVDRGYSSSLFFIFILSMFFFNILASLRFQIKSFFLQSIGNEVDAYIFFAGLKENNLSKTLGVLNGGSASNSTYDICSWYYQRFSEEQGFSVLTHDLRQAAYPFESVSVQNRKYPWFSIYGSRQRSYLLFWWAWAVSLGLTELLRGRWWYAAMLYESSLAKAVSLVDSNRLAKSYLFHYSSSRFRPLWTYTCEKMGSDVIAYFYSTYEQPRVANTSETRFFDYGAITWGKLYVWTKTQKDSILKANIQYKPDVSVVGPVWFEDSGGSLDTLPLNGISVFPVTNHRVVYHRGLSSNAEWLAVYPDLYRRFLMDISSVLRSLGLTMLVKVKRDIGVRERKSTKMLHSELANVDNVHFVDPSISAFRLMARSVAAISMPFTSTALCGPSQDFPSIYYDPTGWIEKTDPAGNGIPILSGIDELECWMNDLVSNIE